MSKYVADHVYRRIFFKEPACKAVPQGMQPTLSRVRGCYPAAFIILVEYMVNDPLCQLLVWEDMFHEKLPSIGFRAAVHPVVNNGFSYLFGYGECQRLAGFLLRKGYAAMYPVKAVD